MDRFVLCGIPGGEALRSWWPALILATAGCAAPQSAPNETTAGLREGVTPASDTTRAELGIDRWHIRERSESSADISAIDGEDANGAVRANVEVQWSWDSQAHYVDISVDGAKERLTRNASGAISSEGEDKLRALPRVQMIARDLAADLDSAAKSTGAQPQGLHPACLGLVCGPGNLLPQDPPGWVLDVSACMKGYRDMGFTEYVGIHSVRMGLHGPRG
jgi:hypothetical protein